MSESLSALQPRHYQPPLSLLPACKQRVSSVLFAWVSLGLRLGFAWASLGFAGFLPPHCFRIPTLHAALCIPQPSIVWGHCRARKGYGAFVAQIPPSACQGPAKQSTSHPGTSFPDDAGFCQIAALAWCFAARLPRWCRSPTTALAGGVTAENGGKGILVLIAQALLTAFAPRQDDTSDLTGLRSRIHSRV
jgi:hypothetical protein